MKELGLPDDHIALLSQAILQCVKFKMRQCKRRQDLGNTHPLTAFFPTFSLVLLAHTAKVRSMLQHNPVAAGVTSTPPGSLPTSPAKPTRQSMHTLDLSPPLERAVHSPC